MLGYFETKNIGRKRERAQAFHGMGDATSETDMEFDWADETLHAEYGRRWLRRLLEAREEDPESWPAVLEECERLVQARVEQATPEELERIRTCADALTAAAEAAAAYPSRPEDV
jgi:transposase-like protein